MSDRIAVRTREIRAGEGRNEEEEQMNSRRGKGELELETAAISERVMLYEHDKGRW